MPRPVGQPRHAQDQHDPERERADPQEEHQRVRMPVTITPLTTTDTGCPTVGAAPRAAEIGVGGMAAHSALTTASTPPAAGPARIAATLSTIGRKPHVLIAPAWIWSTRATVE